MELVMKNNMMLVEKIKPNSITASGVVIPETALEQFNNALPFKVLAVEENNPLGIQVGDYVYPTAGARHFGGRMENEEVYFMDIFSVLAVSKTFDPEKHCTIDYSPKLDLV